MTIRLILERRVIRLEDTSLVFADLYCSDESIAEPHCRVRFGALVRFVLPCEACLCLR